MAGSEVVVVGGGCVGASVAYHLARAGCTDVVLLESDTLASGSTSKAAGGIRMQHADPLNTQLALRSLTEFTQFAELTGAEIDHRQVGYLFLLDSAADLELFRSAGQMQRSLGVPVEFLSPLEARELVPQIEIDDLVGASFCPLDGYATPEAVVHGYAAAARRLGVTVRQGTPVHRILTRAGRVTGVDLGDEQLSADAVVVAAGVGSASIAATAGQVLPVTAERRRIFFSKRAGGIPDAIPLTIDFATGFYFHREGPGLVFAGREFEPEALLEPALRRLPVLGDLPINSFWHGDYEMSPDHNGMVGRAADLAGFFYATGFSGHGFQLSPAVGEHIAEIVLGRTPTIDLAAFGVERFATAAHRTEHIFI